MQWLRTIRRFVRVLVALFMVAQFAGVVSSPLASAKEIPTPATSLMHHHHLDEHDGEATFHHHGNQTGNHHADLCCALHAFFAGVLPAVIAVNAVDAVGQRFAADLADVVNGIGPARLDRPPRPRVVI
jgi:hypothetical protein